MSNFAKRITAPSANDSNYYSSKNLMVKYGYVLPNCTTYVHGRWSEFGIQDIKLSLNDAKTYYGKNDGYARSQTPKLGAIACYDGGQHGHVAIVEEIYPDGTMLVSESDYISKVTFRTERVSQTGNRFGSYKLQGYILSPVNFDESTPAQVQSPNEYKIGDKVKVSTYYASSMDNVDKAVHKVKEGTITRINPGSRNPYLLDNGDIGWCNDGDIRELLNTVTYTIQKGDTLSGIAQRYGKTIDYLKNLNNITNVDLINVGQVLKI